eukprot:TRINITY_DN23156_c0_g1_i1.p1 TRINITY_DN23156_c0_g1~~TRINITY_DN23156_c0_g1_i1.p1  ORF type:complete len:813 (+),score=178.74 TRINITY_DN23156_c0_g1_i1:59-2497(+)
MTRCRDRSSSSGRGGGDKRRKERSRSKKRRDTKRRRSSSSSSDSSRERRQSKRRSRSRSGGRRRKAESGGGRGGDLEAKLEAKRLPKVVAPDLPIAAFKEQIIDLLAENSIIVVVGETGSGKTTQLPQYLLDAEKLDAVLNAPASEETGKKAAAEAAVPVRKRRIAITQPRRVAAVAMAKRVAQERGCRVGAEVGYTIRFEDHSNPETRLRYMTDGCLLRECLSDPDLSGYDVVVLDEAHERSLHTDVLFALMKRAVANRWGKLRVVVTSATLNTGAFSEYFNKCPVLTVPGRAFKVDMHYHPVSKTDRVSAAVNVALNLHVREGPGHILVFLTGMEECEQAVGMANQKLQSLVESGKEVCDCLIVPLYGMMQSEDQRNVFDAVPEGCRKLVFSTNIAETSLTVADVGFVIDCGYCKQKNFNPKTGMESLQVVEVSQVQATQRAGRAGRTQDGKCFRLYSEQSFKTSFSKVTVPEILRSNLASVTLQMKAMGIDNVVGFDFMEAPDRVRLVKSLRILFLLGALDADGKLTDLGKEMSQFPLEPQFARVLIAASELGCAEDALTLVSLLSSESVWYRPSRAHSDEVRAADRAQSEFVHSLGDHTTLLNVYRHWEESGCGGPDWCKKHYLHFRALRQARDIRSQLCEQVQKNGVALRSRRGGNGDDYSGVLQALCAGFYMQTARACAAGGGWLIVGENILVKPEASSAIEGHSPQWVLYTELVGSTIAHVLMRNVSAVDPAWLKPLLPKLDEVDLKRLVGEWKQKKQAQEPEKDAAELAKEKETKVSSAKERYLARKAAGTTTAAAAKSGRRGA